MGYNVLHQSVWQSIRPYVSPSVISQMFRRIFLRKYIKDSWNLVTRWISVSFSVWCISRLISKQLPVYFLLTEHFYHFTYDSQVKNCRHIFLRNYNNNFEIWFQGLNKSSLPCDAFSDSSLKTFLFTERLYNFTYDSQVENFWHIFLKNCNMRISKIWFQGL